jgi:hypothetical protein
MFAIIILYFMTLDQIRQDIIDRYPLDDPNVIEISRRIIAEDPTIEGFAIHIVGNEPNEVRFYRHRPVVLCEICVLRALALNWLAETRKAYPRVLGECNELSVYFGEFSGDLNNDGFVDISDLAILSANTIKYGVVFPERPLDEGPPLLEVIYELYSEMEQ